MEQIKFPHGIQAPTSMNDGVAKIVSDELDKDGVYTFPDIKGYWIIDEILLTRKAKGDWQKWFVHPDFFEVKMSSVENPIPDKIVRCN